MHVLMRVYMVEPQPCPAKRLELRADFTPELAAHMRQKEEPDPRAGHVAVELAIAADESGDFGRRQRRAAIDQGKMQPDA